MGSGRAIAVLAFAAAVCAAPTLADADCRYPGSGNDAEEYSKNALLPGGDLFRPLLADMHEPRFYAGYRYLRIIDGPADQGGGDDEFGAGVVAMGATAGVWRLANHEDPCNGLQVNAFGGIFSQFNLDAPSNPLINSDFFVGGTVTGRWGRYSGRIRVFHQSSHLGDELLLNDPNITRIDHSFEGVDFVGSVEGDLWRVYAGITTLFHSSPKLDPLMARGGAELRGPWKWPVGRVDFELEAGFDLLAIQERDWGATASLKAGISASRPTSYRRARLLFVYLRGFVPFGQFFDTEKVDNIGIEIQVDL